VVPQQQPPQGDVACGVAPPHVANGLGARGGSRNVSDTVTDVPAPQILELPLHFNRHVSWRAKTARTNE
jgi:hypothetical protein